LGFLNVFWSILLMVFDWFLDLSIQSWITLVLTKYFSPACIFSLSRSLRMQKVLVWAKISLFCRQILAFLVAQENTFLQRKPESGSFGQRRSHQDYQGVLNTVCTQRRCLETNVYIIYTFYQPAFVELQNVKGWKLFKITNGKTETNWMRNLQFFVANHLWISFSFFVISNILQPCLFGPRPTNGNSLMKFLVDLMSALFPDDHHQRFPQLGSKGAHQGENSLW